METIIPVTLFISAFAMVFALRYFSNKEKMGMIERGINPGIGQSAPKPFVSLKFGLLLVGLGLGLLGALLLVRSANLEESDAVAVYFGCIGIFGGLGLIVSYIIEKKWLDEKGS